MNTENEKAQSFEEYNECPPNAAGLLADIDIFRMLRQPNEAINRIELFVKSHTEPLQSRIADLEQDLAKSQEKCKAYEGVLRNINEVNGVVNFFSSYNQMREAIESSFEISEQALATQSPDND